MNLRDHKSCEERFFTNAIHKSYISVLDYINVSGRG